MKKSPEILITRDKNKTVLGAIRLPLIAYRLIHYAYSHVNYYSIHYAVKFWPHDTLDISQMSCYLSMIDGLFVVINAV
jgi:hypothetical protein